MWGPSRRACFLWWARICVRPDRRREVEEHARQGNPRTIGFSDLMLQMLGVKYPPPFLVAGRLQRRDTTTTTTTVTDAGCVSSIERRDARQLPWADVLLGGSSGLRRCVRHARVVIPIR